MDKMATGKGFRRGTRQGRGHEGAVSLRVWRDAGLDGWKAASPIPYRARLDSNSRPPRLPAAVAQGVILSWYSKRWPSESILGPGTPALAP